MTQNTPRPPMEFPHLYRCGHIEAACMPTMRETSRLPFPHLYRCGHIEAVRDSSPDRSSAANFRIFIDAATLKPRSATAYPQAGSDFRIFIDAATLKRVSLWPRGACAPSYFRIFIDAATLKLALLGFPLARLFMISASL